MVRTAYDGQTPDSILSVILPPVASVSVRQERHMVFFYQRLPLLFQGQVVAAVADPLVRTRFLHVLHHPVHARMYTNSLGAGRPVTTLPIVTMRSLRPFIRLSAILYAS